MVLSEANEANARTTVLPRRCNLGGKEQREKRRIWREWPRAIQRCPQRLITSRRKLRHPGPRSCTLKLKAPPSPKKSSAPATPFQAFVRVDPEQAPGGGICSEDWCCLPVIRYDLCCTSSKLKEDTYRGTSKSSSLCYHGCAIVTVT